MRIEKIIGLDIILISIMVTMHLEGLHILSLLLAPSALVLVLGISIGGTMLSLDRSDMKKMPISLKIFFSDGAKSNQEELRIYVRLYSMASRYSMYAGWFGLLLGIICMLSSLEEFIEKDKNIEVLAGGITLASMSLLYGTLYSKLFFDPLKNWFEWQIERPPESG